MKKQLTLVIDTENAYNNKLLFGNEEVDTGQSGLRFTIDQSPSNKRTVYLIRTTQVNVILKGSHCPEEWRFEQVERAFGDREAIRQLLPKCEMIQMSPRACEGCPYHPKKSRDMVKR